MPAPKPLDPTASLQAYFGWRVRVLRGDRTQGYVARRISRTLALVSKLETAEIPPTAEVAAALDEVLGAGGELVALQALLEHERHQERRLAALPADQAGRTIRNVAVQVEGREVSDVRRRNFVIGASAGAAALIADRLLAALEANRLAGATSLAPGTIDGLGQAVAYYSRNVYRLDPHTAYPEVLALRGYAGELMGGKLKLKEHHELVVLAGWLSALMALVCFDRGDYPAALAWCNDAEDRGAEAGHPALAAWPAETRVRVALYEGRPSEAVDAVRAGLAMAPAGSAARARLQWQEVRTLAEDGKRDEARAAMREAEGAVRQLRPTSEPNGAFNLDAQQGTDMYDYLFRTRPLILLGEHAEAARLCEVAARAFDPERQPGALAMNRLDLAMARIGLGQLDGAAEAGMAALNTLRLVAANVARAGELDAALQRRYPGTAEARDFHERYVTVRREVEQRAITAS